MTSGDVVSSVLAGVALVLAMGVAIVMFASPHHRLRLKRAAGSTIGPVGIRLVPSTGTGLGYWWRFQTSPDAPPTSVDIFSYRSRSSSDTPWQHELLEASLALTPAEPTYLRAPALATAGAIYDVSIGWTLNGAGAGSRGSAIMTVEPEPYI